MFGGWKLCSVTRCVCEGVAGAGGVGYPLLLTHTRRWEGVEAGACGCVGSLVAHKRPRISSLLARTMAPLPRGLIIALVLISHHAADAHACTCPLHSTDQNVRTCPALDLRSNAPRYLPADI